jgi:hypothetical protein
MSVLMAFNAAIMGMIANGVILVKHAFASGMLPCVIPAFDPLIGGLVLILFGMALLLRVPLRLVDAIFQLFVIAVLLPILVVAWVFPYGKNYAKKGLDMLIGVLGMFITMAVMIAIVTVILKELAGGAEKISTAKDLADAFSWNSVKEGMLGLLTWVGTLWFCYVGFGSVTDYAETLFGAPKQNIGKGVTDLAEKGLKAAGTTAAHGAAGAGVLAGRGAWMGAKGAGGLAVRGVRSLAGWAQNRRGGPGAANAPNPTPGPSLAPTPAMRSMLNSLNNAAAAKKSQIPQKALPAHAQSGTPQSPSQPSPSPLGPGTPPTPQLSLPEHASGSPPSSPQTPLGGNPQTGTQQSDHIPEATKTQPGSTSSNSGGGQGSGNAQN